MKAKKSYKNGGKTKVTGAKTSINKGVERLEAGDAYRLAAAAGGGRRAAKILKKEGLAGTAQNPSPAMYGARTAASVLGEDTSTIPMRKRTVRSLKTSGGPKKELKKSTAKIPVPPSKKRKKKLRRRK